MLAFYPVIRATETEEYGPVVIHHDEGVIGYGVGFSPGQERVLEGYASEGDSATRHAAVLDIIAWSGTDPQGPIAEILTYLGLGFSGRSAGKDIFPLETLIAVNALIVRWHDKRRAAWLDGGRDMVENPD